MRDASAEHLSHRICRRVCNFMEVAGSERYFIGVHRWSGKEDRVKVVS